MSHNKTILQFGLISILLFCFQNCGSPNQVEATQSSAASATTAPLKISVDKSHLAPGESAQISAEGGVKPYTFISLSGPGAVNSDSGSLQTGSSEGVIVVLVKDKTGASIQTSIVVTKPAVTTNSCLTPWGETIAHGATVVAYGSANLACGQSCSASQETRTCNNGTLSGSMIQKSCAVAACPIYRWVNVLSAADNQTVACARAGLQPAENQGYGICASGEAKPQSTQGANVSGIRFLYGTFGGASSGGLDVPQGSGGNATHYCFRSGQVRDYDTTDLTVAYLCK